MIDTIQALDANIPIVIQLDNQQVGTSINAGLAGYRTVILELIEEEGVSFYDVYNFFGNYVVETTFGNTDNDDVHPNTQGYEKIAFNLASALFGNYQKFASLQNPGIFKYNMTFAEGILLPNVSSGSAIIVQSGADNVWKVGVTGIEYHNDSKRTYYGTDDDVFSEFVPGGPYYRTYFGGNQWVLGSNAQIGLGTTTLAASGQKYMISTGGNMGNMPDSLHAALDVETKNNYGHWITRNGNNEETILGLNGTDAFATTDVADTLVMAGGTTNSIYMVSVKDVSPVAADLLSWQAKTDTLIVHRAAGTTSGLTYSWMRLK